MTFLQRKLSVKRTVEDFLLITKAKRGDREAFGKLYIAYLPSIYRYIYYHIDRNHDEAEDIAETVLVSAWKAIGTYRIGKGSFRVWLFAIAHNAVIDYYRNRAAHVELPILPSVPDETATGHTPEETLVAADKAAAVSDALNKLSDEHKQIIVLRYMEDMPYAHIAKIIGKRQDALRALHHRALVALKKLLENQ